MDPQLFSPNDSILFVGEGNFSFSLSFKLSNDNVQYMASSCYEDKNFSETTLRNMNTLKKEGVPVYVGVDATKLTSYEHLMKHNFNCIIFNFPHIGGKMKIDKNRELLKEFFASAALLLALSNIKKDCERRVIVSLCKGQGGTPADGDNLRTWADSWQIVEMAAMSSLILTDVDRFKHEYCHDYSSVGYRSKERWFHTENSLVHIFKPQVPVELNYYQQESEIIIIHTKDGQISCEKFYIDYSTDFKEFQPKNYEYSPRDNSIEKYLFNSLINEFNNIEFIAPQHLSFISKINKESNVICNIGTSSEEKQLRSSLFDMDHSFKDSFISYGPVFTLYSKDFDNPPCKMQAIIKSNDIDNIKQIIINWIMKILNKKEIDLIKILNEEWKIISNGKILADNDENVIIIELNAIAIEKYKLNGFRDLKGAKIINESECQLESLYPRTHILDICFIEDEENFNEDKLLKLIWFNLGQWIINVQYLERYIPDNGENWVSRLYRIYYRSSKQPLSRVNAIKIHQTFLSNLLISNKLAIKVL